MIYKEIILEGDISLYDSNIQRINLYQYLNVDTVYLEIDFRLVYPMDSYLRLIFKTVLEYSFYWKADSDFYTVDAYKLLKSEKDIYYCSLDPIDSDFSIKEEDKAVIVSRELEVFHFTEKQFEKENIINFHT